MLSKLKQIEDLLLTVSPDVYHYYAIHKPDRYIVWAEDAEGSSAESDNRKRLHSIQGTIDYFTRTDWDETVDKIQNALAGACISFYLGSVQYEEETGYQHYEWVWEVA